MESYQYTYLLPRYLHLVTVNNSDLGFQDSLLLENDL